MRRQRRRPMHYLASSLYDGTVLAACPIRKPSKRIMKRDGLRVDADGVTQESLRDGRELTRVENRTRFQDIIAVNLNVRRTLRELVLPDLKAVLDEVRLLRARLDEIQDRTKA